MALAPLLYNITFNSQTRILYFWDKAGHEIYHCEIPSPAPALPTVSNTMYLFNSSGGLNIGQINTLLDSNNNTVDYDTTACYACQNCMDSSGVAKNPTSLAIVNESGILKVTNISDNYISVYYVRTKKCSSNLATVITVYDSSSNPYNAFKYTSDGTDYYYVLDGTQTDWTDDLSSIGYQVLPTVSMEGDYSSFNWIYVKSDQSVASLVANASLNTYYYDTSTAMPSYYDTNKSYAVIQWQKTAGTTAGRIECAFENNGGYLAIKNVSSATISIKQARVAVCSSNLATVVTVYNGSNVAYNAFKYISGGTDYYYVLDGTQTDWTDDLSGIGYHVPPSLPTVSVINGIVGSTSAYGTRNIPNGSSVYQWVNNGGWALVTVASGNVIAFQRIANGSDGNVKYSGFDAQITQDGYVQVTNNTGSSYYSAFYLVTAICSSSSATVITVYDSSNNPYNAFQYTSDGTDYYYVLDGTQTDWTDDLESIGYQQSRKAYANANKTNRYMFRNTPSNV